MNEIYVGGGSGGNTQRRLVSFPFLVALRRNHIPTEVLPLLCLVLTMEARVGPGVALGLPGWLGPLASQLDVVVHVTMSHQILQFFLRVHVLLVLIP